MVNKKICLVIPSLQAGGMERVMAELANYFDRKKEIEVHLVLYGITRELFYGIQEGIVVHKPSFRFNNKLRIYYSFKTLLFLRRTIQKIDPASILSFGELWNNFVLLSLLGSKYPVYVSDRCQPDKKFGRFHESLRKFLYPKASGIIAQTETAKEFYASKFKHPNIEVIGNPIRRINRIENIRREQIVLTVGRLIRSKHHDKLIEMFLEIGKPDWKLIIIGYDHLKQQNSTRLKKIIEDNKAEDRVLLEGKQSDVESYYLRSSVFAFSSSSEGFPNAIGEAMSAGLPVVAFDCVAGPSELIKDNYSGFLIPLFNYDLFREKLALLMENLELREKLGKNAVDSISRYSMKAIGDRLLTFISPSQ